MDKPVTPMRERGVLFTAENAAEMAKRAAKSRAANTAKRKEEERLTRLSPEYRNAQRDKERVELVVEQITRTREELNKDTLDARERAQLLCALDKLLDRERVLLGRPLPGSRRPGREKTVRSSGTSAPLDAE